MYEIYSEVLESLKGIEVKSSKLGIEANISPSEYPIIRVVPTLSKLDELNGHSKTLYFSVFVGDKLTQNKGLSFMYEKLYAYENEIIKALHNKVLKDNSLVRYKETKDDEDELLNFKVLKLSFEVKEVKLKII